MSIEFNVHPRKRGDTWAYQIMIKDDKDNWIYHSSKSGFKTKTEANTAGLNAGALIKPQPKAAKGTFKEIADLYIADGKREESTRKAYRSWLKNLFEIWDKPITKITYTDVAPLIFGYYDTHKYTGTISLITLGKSIFRYAERKLKIQLDNPFLEVKISKKSNKTKKIPNVLTFKQMTAAFKKIENPEHRWLAMCAGLAGMRISEARGLMPNAFNLKKNQIEVTQQRTADDTIKECLKSDDGERIIPLHPLLKTEYKRLPVPISKNTLLIQTYYHSDIMSKAIRKTGYPEASTHTLRHSFATICIQNGMDFKTLASIMGDKLETIIKTYSHVNTEMRDAAKEIIKNF